MENISLILSALAFAASCIWAYNVHDYEPIIGVITSFATFLGLLFNRNYSKYNQPKLSISIPHASKMRSRADDAMFLPASYPHEPGQPFDYEAQAVMMYHWELLWFGEMHITNDSEFTAYKLKILIPESHNGAFVLKKPIDETKPFASTKTRKYAFECKRYFVGTGAQADQIMMKKLPIESLRLTYENARGIQCSTSFSPNQSDSNLRNLHFIHKPGME